MSLAACVDCGRTVDTDDEPEAYTLTHADGTEEQTEKCRCELCRSLDGELPSGVDA